MAGRGTRAALGFSRGFSRRENALFNFFDFISRATNGSDDPRGAVSEFAGGVARTPSLRAAYELKQRFSTERIALYARSLRG